MGHFPAILKESKNVKAPFHIGGVLSFMRPLCGNFSDDEMDILGWVSSRNWTPNEKFCRECAESYRHGDAWKIPSMRGKKTKSLTNE